MFDRPNP